MTELKAWLAKNKNFLVEGNADKIFEENNQFYRRRALRNAVFPGKEQFENMPDNFVDTAVKIADTYLTAMKNHEAELKRIDNSFKGDELKKRYSEQKEKAPNLAKYIDALNTFAELERLQLDAIEAKSFDAQNISPDFKFLQLPITLTVEEVQRLHSRNAENPLFCRALQKYCTDNKIDAMDGALDLRDSISVRRSIIDSLYDTHVSAMQDFDEFSLALLESTGCYDSARRTLGADIDIDGEGTKDTDFLEGFNP